MKKRERVFAAMKHEPVDRIPCYFTTHFAREAAFGQAAVEEHLKFFREVNPDIQKIMNEHLVPNMGSIKTPEDCKCIMPITLKDKFMAVSYTHLDVYKRQHMMSGQGWTRALARR